MLFTYDILASPLTVLLQSCQANVCIAPQSYVASLAVDLVFACVALAKVGFSQVELR